MTTHERLSKDVRVTMYFKPVRSDTTIRLTCVCGFKTDWYEGSDAGSELADKAMAKHFDFWSDGPKRDCGHDFTHVGECLLCPDLPVETL